jgi:tyrosyl-tRNA synthetase
MFGRTMRIPDSQLEEWWTLVAEQPVPEGDPMEAKLALARLIVTRSHGEEAAQEAEEHFTRVVRRGEAPEEVPEVTWSRTDDSPVYLPGALKTWFGESASHWRRQIDQGGIRVNGEAVSSYEIEPSSLDGALVQAGKRRFRLVHLA